MVLFSFVHLHDRWLCCTYHIQHIISQATGTADNGHAIIQTVTHTENLERLKILKNDI